MFITKARKFHKDDDGRYVAYDYYRLTKARLTPEGKKRNEHLLCLGTLDGMTKAERNELADMLTVMIEEGQSVMSFNPVLYEKAIPQNMLFNIIRDTAWHALRYCLVYSKILSGILKDTV